MRVFRRPYRDRHGKLQTTATYSIAWRDHLADVKRTWGCRFTDKGAARAYGLRLERLSQIRAAADPLPEDMTDWLRVQPVKILHKLIDIGLADGELLSQTQPLDKYLDQWIESRAERKRSERNTRMVANRIRAVLHAGGFTTWRDITLSRFERALDKLRADRDLSDATANTYAEQFGAFLNWMHYKRITGPSPIKRWQPIEIPDDGEYRRALSVDEASVLLSWVAREDRGRALLYRLAIETTQRRGALEALTVADLQLDHDPPLAVFRARPGTKSRKRIDLPLKPATAEALREHVRGKLPTAPVFRVLQHSGRRLRLDAERARAWWGEQAETPEERHRRLQGDFLAPEDSEGRRIDFHALRDTGASWLANAGVANHVATKVTGHGRTHTLRFHYQRATLDQRAAAIDAMPDVSVRADDPESARVGVAQRAPA